MKNNHLDEKTISELKEKLEQEKSRLESELKNIATKNPDVKGDWEAKYKDIGDDWDENAQEVTNYDASVSIEHTLEKQLQEVNAALGRIENNTYGFCSKDGEPIPVERLIANPEAATCIKHSNNNAS